jgi:hypothetical protein
VPGTTRAPGEALVDVVGKEKPWTRVLVLLWMNCAALASLLQHDGPYFYQLQSKWIALASKIPFCEINMWYCGTVF